MPNRIREVVGVFDGTDALEDVVFDLETKGFDRGAFSLLASEHTVKRKLGHRYRRVQDMEDEPKAPRETFFSRASRLEAEFGPAPALALIAAVAFGLGSAAITLPILIAAGTGAAVGVLLGRMFHRSYAERIQEQVERGGLLLWVSVYNRQQERKALSAFKAHGARDVHVHDLPL